MAPLSDPVLNAGPVMTAQVAVKLCEIVYLSRGTGGERERYCLTHGPDAHLVVDHHNQVDHCVEGYLQALPVLQAAEKVMAERRLDVENLRQLRRAARYAVLAEIDSGAGTVVVRLPSVNNEHTTIDGSENRDIRLAAVRLLRNTLGVEVPEDQLDITFTTPETEQGGD